MQDATGIAELSRPDFLGGVDAFLAIYAAAMGARQDELPSRRAIMERHSGNPGFRALAVYDRRPVAARNNAGPGDRTLAHSAAPAQIVAFTYGFHGRSGQWWHDVVRSGLTSHADAAAARDWLGDVMEIAEVHVHPDYQARGIGRAMMLALTAGRTERTAVLSTRDDDTRARRLYRSLGFSDLLTDFLFPGGGPPYAVMGAALPLGPRPST